MKRLGYIKTALLLAVTIFLFAFAKNRNAGRSISAPQVHFTNSENLYITEDAVNKLLIQTGLQGKAVAEEILDLKEVEAVLNADAMIENAEVYLNIDGKLGAKITQRKPIARVFDGSSYYLDRQGLPMPLSPYHSARVPILTGVSQSQLQEVFPVVTYLGKDPFWVRHLTAIHRQGNGTLELSLRGMDFVVHLGKAEDLERKLNNFKAFYQKAIQDEKLHTFEKVDLRFGNQVVCTKK